MSECCPECNSENYEVLDYQEDFEIGSVSMWWKCKCPCCGCLFEIGRTYNIDPYYSYVQKMEDNEE
jgi:hypothetical protein